MIKCQSCDETATLHLTEIVGGKPLEYHVCEKHADDLHRLKPTMVQPRKPGLGTLWKDPEIYKALSDPVARTKMAAYFLPSLCAALLDHNAEVRICAAFQMMWLGADAKSAIGALREALKDRDERLRKVCELAIQHIETEEAPFCWFPV